MTCEEQIGAFDELVDLLRERLGYADAINPSLAHNFRELMADRSDVISDNWPWEAFDELDALGHIDRAASGKAKGGDAHARLSAEGRWYLRESSALDRHQGPR
jgi:hypothetical protein